MSFPSTYRAISEMVSDVALETPTARDIVRKAGLSVAGGTGVSGGRARTLVDAWVMPSTTAYQNQWYVDLSPYTEVRFTAQSGLTTEVELYYSMGSVLGTSPLVLNPADWDYHWGDFFMSATRPDEYFDVSLAASIGWAALSEGLKRPVRVLLGLNHSTLPLSLRYTIHPLQVDGPFNIALEAR